MLEMDGSTFRACGLADMRKGDLKAPGAWDRAKVHEITGGKRWQGVQHYKNILIKELP